MRGGLDRLQKELDTLTYNSRSVLNALIRSTVTGGSSNGYTVTRAGTKFVLTRVDIYRLYKFYQAWETANFGVNDFIDILTEQDKIPVRDEKGIVSSHSTTDALVAHSKILYYIASDSANVNVTSYWLNKIQNAQNPKLVSNFAPIPLNLRTPTFDENMSTKEYSQYETYLFPASYYSTSIFGYQGDDTDHFLNGKSWTLSTDEYISLETYALATGMVNTGATLKTKARRNYDVAFNGGNKKTFSSNFGYDTHSRGKNSIAGGVSSIATSSAYAGIALGDSNLASNIESTSIGGTLNIAASHGGSVFGGDYGMVTGDYGAILGGVRNVVGAPVDFFITKSIASSDPCIIVAADCNTTTQSTGTAVISISGDVRTRYKKDDTIRLFDFTYLTDNIPQHYYDLNGDGLNTVDLVIDSISYDVLTTSTIITFASKIPYQIYGGSVSRFKSGSTLFGYASTAMGYGSIASGMYQTVVGTFNYAKSDSLFIVGNGTNYIRSNVLEVRNDGIDIYGVPYSDPALVTDVIPRYSHFYVGPNSILQALGGSYASISDVYATFRTSDTTTGEYIGLLLSADGNNNTNGSGVELKTSNKPLLIRNAGFDLSARIDINEIAGDNSILTASIGTNSVIAQNRLLLQSIESDVYITCSTDITMNWGRNLILKGNTFGALPTDNTQMPYWCTTNTDIKNYTVGTNIYPSNIVKAGFYEFSGTALTGNDLSGNHDTIFDYVKNHYYWVGQTGDAPVYSETPITSFATPDTSVWSYNMLNIAGHGASKINDDGYHSTQLYFPYSDPGTLRNIIVQQGAMSSDGTWLGDHTDELAYRSNLTAVQSDLMNTIQLQSTTYTYHSKEDAFSGIVFYDTANNYKQFAINEFVYNKDTTSIKYPIIKTRLSTFKSNVGLTTFKCSVWFYGASVLNSASGNAYWVGATHDIYLGLNDSFAELLSLESATATNTTTFGYGAYAVNGNSNFTQKTVSLGDPNPENGTIVAGLVNTDKIYKKGTHGDEIISITDSGIKSYASVIFANHHVLHIHSNKYTFADYFKKPNTVDKLPLTDYPWILDFTFTIDGNFKTYNTDFA